MESDSRAYVLFIDEQRTAKAAKDAVLNVLLKWVERNWERYPTIGKRVLSVAESLAS